MTGLALILFNLIKPIVKDSDGISVKEMPTLDDNEILLHVYANSDDLSRLIGKKGVMANSLKQMLLVSTKSSKKKITINFDIL